MLASGGCVTHTYTASPPPLAARAGVEIEARSVGYSPSFPGAGVEITAAVRASGELRVDRAVLAPVSASPCSGGVPARTLQVRRAGWVLDTNAVLDSTAHSTDIVFPLGEVNELGLFRERAAALDLALRPVDEAAAPPSCLRLALGGAGAPGRWREDPTFYGGLWFRVLGLPHASLDAVGLMALAGGLEVGPARLGVELGLGEGNERFGTGARAAALLDTASVTAETWLGGLGGGNAYRKLGFTGVLAFDVAHGWARSGSGSNTWYGPRLGLRLLRIPADPPWQGFEGRPGSNGFGLEVYGARWWSTAGDGAWGLGVGVGGQTTW